MKHINTICQQCEELLALNIAVRTESGSLERVNSHEYFDVVCTVHHIAQC